VSSKSCYGFATRLAKETVTALTSKTGAGVPTAGAGAVLKIIRDLGRPTRAELAEATGLSRSTLSGRLDVLMGSELVREGAAVPSDGGRPRGTLELNPSAGVLLVADVEATWTRVALLDLAAGSLSELSVPLPVTDGPVRFLEALAAVFDRVLRAGGRSDVDLHGIGIGLPAPVSFSAGAPVHPPLMPGWHEFPVRDWLAGRYGVPVVVDNDVNLMAFGERQTWFEDCDHLLFVKVGAGIGCGIAAIGRLLRGADGAAGDIGHVRVAGREHVRCNCGNQGCLEAVAGGPAIATRLAEAGRDVTTVDDIVHLVQAGDALANRLVREAGRDIGEVLGRCVSLFNPAAIVVGGPLMQAQQPLLAGVREATIARSAPLASRHLRIVPSRLGERAGVVGAGLLLCEHLFDPAMIEDVVERRR
jgi:predicted NBD/HSP70 family sugar kinase